MTRTESSVSEFGHYRVYDLLGSGGMGVVHRAFDTVHRRTIALKRLPSSTVDDDFRARFERESRIAASLRHPHVVPVNAFGEIGGQLYLDMMLVEGTDLQREIGFAALDARRAIEILSQVAQALDAAHGAGVIHRDVKPSNVLIDRTGHAYLTDFGIARHMSPDAAALTGTGAVIGTLDYMAPERLYHGPVVDGRSDQYSLACVLFECLTGRVPYPDTAPTAKVAHHLLQPPSAPSTFDPTVPPALDEVVLRGLAKDPERRFATAGELLGAAEAAMRTSPAVGSGRTTASGPVREQARLIRAVLRTNVAPGPPPGDDPAAPVCPYPGLRSFGPDDARWFHGRSRVVTDLLVRLAEQLDGGEPVALVAASGSGKSSVLHAGLLPALTATDAVESDPWPTVVCTPGPRPVDQLAVAVGPLLGTPPAELAAAIRDSPATFGARFTPVHDRGALRAIIVVDQFEELFTADVPEADRVAFATALAHARPALVVLAVRADLVQRCIELPALVPAFSAPMLLGPMTATELREAIVAPARDAGIAVEPGLPERLIADLGVRDESGYDPGALPRLAHALRETWNRGTGTGLTLAAYREVGGIDGAVARTAEHVYAALDGSSQQVARTLLLRLVVVPEDGITVRRRVELDTLTALDDEAGVLDRLITARLVTVDDTGAQLAHEALLTAWPRLRDWIDLDRAGLIQHRRFAEAAQVWTDSGRQSDDLYRGARLATVNAWRQTTADQAPLSPVEQEFLEHSNAADRDGLAHERRRTRRLRTLVATLSVLLLVAAGAVAVATWLRAAADDARRLSLSRQLALSAMLARGVDPQKATLLTLGAWQAAPTTEARSQLISSTVDAYSGVMDTGHRGEATAVALSDDGRVAVSGGVDGTLRLWDVPTRREVGRLDETGGAYRELSMSPDGRLLAAVDQQRDRATLWSVDGRRLLFTAPEPAVETAIAPDGRTFATLVEAGQLVIRNTATRSDVGRFTVGTTTLRMAYSPDGASIAVTDGPDIAVIRVSDGARLATLTGHTANVNFVSFDRSGSRLASAALDGTVRVWDVAAATQALLLTPPTGMAYAALFQQDDELVIGDSGPGLYYFDLTTGTAIGRTAGPSPTTTAVAVSRDGHTVLGTGVDGLVTVWTVGRRSLEMKNQAIVAVAAQPGGPLLAVVTGDGTGWLWDRTADDRPRPLAGHPGRLQGAAFSPDGTRLATVGADGTVLLWDPVGGGPVGRFTRPGTALTDAAFSPDGRTLAVAGRRDRAPGEVLLLNASDLTLRRQRDAEVLTGDPNDESTESVGAVAFSPDGRLLAVPGTSGRIALWDLAEPAAPVRVLDGHTGFALDAAFSPDGRLLATAGADRFVRIWNVADGRQVAALEGVAVVRKVAFSPDGATLAAASRESVVRLWEVPGWQPFATMDRHVDDLNRLTFDDRGELITAGADGRALIWDLDPDRATRELCRRLHPSAIPEQWRQLGSDLGEPPTCPS